jgi:hypothetical protein
MLTMEDLGIYGADFSMTSNQLLNNEWFHCYDIVIYLHTQNIYRVPIVAKYCQLNVYTTKEQHGSDIDILLICIFPFFMFTFYNIWLLTSLRE